MRHFHITRELLHAVHSGERHPGELADLTLHHVFDLCPICKAEFLAYEKECQEQGIAAYGPVVEHAFAEAQADALEISADRHRATELLESLLALPACDRAATIEAEPLVYRGPALAELLLEHSRNQLPGRPQEAHAAAQLTQAVLHHTDSSTYATELYARTTAHAANALRVSGRLVEAETLLGSARYILRDDAGGDRLVRAELDRLEGALRLDQRRFSEAIRLLRRAALAYSAEDRPADAARTSITLGAVHFELGDWAAATEQAHSALDLLANEDEPRLILYARHNLADYLCEEGRFEEARSAVIELQSLYALHGDPLSHLRLAWLEGKISRGLDELEHAEALFAAARQGFLSRGIAYDAALVSLELATLYLEQRRTAEVKTLAAEMVTVFEDLDIHREALAAALLFRDAADLERVTRELIQHLATYLPRAQRDPAYAFQSAS